MILAFDNIMTTKKIVIALVNHIIIPLGFDNMMSRYSRSPIKEKFSQQIKPYDPKHCNLIGLSDNKLTAKEIEF